MARTRDSGTSDALPRRRRRAGAARGPAAPERGRIRWHIVVIAVIGVVLIGSAVVVVPYFFRAHPGAKSVKSVVKGFKAGSSSAVARNLAYEPPAQGVYTLKGYGAEQIVFPPNSQNDGAVMPASVTYVAHGCWRWRVDYNVAHWEVYDFCPTVTELLEGEEANSQSWDFGTIKINNLARFTCGSDAVVLPEHPTAGQTLKWFCTGSNTSVSGRTLQRIVIHILGTHDLRIGTSDIPTVQEVQDLTLSGAQHGTVKENWWFSARSGLPVRMNRQITVLSSSPVGTVTYHENGSWKMESLQPRHGATKKSSAAKS